MGKYPKVPTPFWVQWREIRHGVFPFLLFGAVLTFTVGLWDNVKPGGTASGIGDGVRTTVASPQSGRLQAVLVRPYQMVNAGDPIAIVTPYDPRAHLDLLQAELQIVRMQLQPSVAEQNVMSFERLRLELAQTKSELAIAKVNLSRAENEVRRNAPLFEEKLVSEDVYDLSLKTRDAFQAEIEVKSRAVTEIEDRMRKLRGFADPEADVQQASTQALLERLEAIRGTLATNWQPVFLEAPITGMIGPIYRQAGSYVVDGEPLIDVHSVWAERVVGYLRQPYPVDPAVGLKVEIIPRNPGRKTILSEIIQVGAQVEIITNSLAYVRQGVLVDAGLPIIVALPGNGRIRPGEVVDLVIEPDPATKPSLIGWLMNKSK